MVRGERREGDTFFQFSFQKKNVVDVGISSYSFSVVRATVAQQAYQTAEQHGASTNCRAFLKLQISSVSVPMQRIN